MAMRRICAAIAWLCPETRLQAVAEGGRRRVLESDVVGRAHERKLRLEPVMRDQRHDLLRRQGALDLLAVEHRRLDLLPGARRAGPHAALRESLRALPVATAEARGDEISDPAGLGKDFGLRLGVEVGDEFLHLLEPDANDGSLRV